MNNEKSAGSKSSQVAAPPQNVHQEASIKTKQLPRSGSVRKYQKSTEIWLKENRDAVLVAASVIAAMAYQAGINPPGGVWQDEKGKHYPGTSIMADNFQGRSEWFWTFNTVSFISSLSIIFLLISGIPLKQRIIMWILMVSMWMTITCMTLTYLISMQAISPDHEMATITFMVVISVYGWLMLMSLVFLVHFVYFFVWFLQNIRHLREQNLTYLKFMRALFLRCNEVM